MSLFVLAASSLGFIMWATLLSITSNLTVIGREMGLGFSELGLVFSFPLLMLAVFALPGGILADRIGPRKTGALGGAVIGVGGLLRSTSTDLESLILFSGVFGVGWGLGLPALPKLVGGWFRGKIAGTVTGIYTLGIYLGAGVGTALTFSISWRNNLVFWGAVSLGVSFFWWLLVRDPPGAHAGGSVGIRKVLGRRSVWILTAIFFLGANVTFYALTGWLPTILATNMSMATAALLASLLSFAAGAATIVVPALSDRIKRRRVFIWFPAIVGAGASFLLFDAVFAIQAVAVLLLGAAISSIFVISLILPIELVPNELVGSTSGVMLLGYLGGLVGPWFAGVARDLTASFTPTLVMLALCFTATIGLTSFLPETANVLPTSQK